MAQLGNWWSLLIGVSDVYTFWSLSRCSKANAAAIRDADAAARQAKGAASKQRNQQNQATKQAVKSSTNIHNYIKVTTKYKKFYPLGFNDHMGWLENEPFFWRCEFPIETWGIFQQSPCDRWNPEGRSVFRERLGWLPSNQPSEVSILARRRDALLKEVDDFTRQDGHGGWWGERKREDTILAIECCSAKFVQRWIFISKRGNLLYDYIFILLFREMILFVVQLTA